MRLAKRNANRDEGTDIDGQRDRTCHRPWDHCR